ncbi:MAG: ABC transporter permease [Candidatus Dormibacteria bacterium]
MLNGQGLRRAPAATVSVAARLVVARSELILLPALVLATVFLPHALVSGRAVGLGVVAFGIAAGAPLALQGIGMLLVYRSNRIINFAQPALGVAGGLIFYELWSQRVFILLWGKLCSCMPNDLAYAPWGWMLANFLLAALVGLVVGPAMGWLVYALVIRRFEKDPPLVLTMLSVALAYLIFAVAGFIWTAVAQAAAGVQAGGGAGSVQSSTGADLPLDLIVGVDGTLLHLQALLGVFSVLAVAGGIGLLLKRSSVGVGLRAASDDLTRARTLGIKTGQVKGLVWGIAGAVSALAAVLGNFVGQPHLSTSDPIDTTTLVELLAIVIIARLRSIPVVVLAAFSIGVIKTALTFTSGTESLFLGLLCPLIAVFLFLQRERMSRAEQELATSWPAANEVRPVPRELAPLPPVRRVQRIGIVVGAMVLLGYPWVTSPAQTISASQAMVYAMVALSLLVLSGWAGQISLGQFALAVVGGFVTTMLTGVAGWPWWIAILAGGAAGTGAATLVAFPALRLPGLYLAATTLALNLTMTSLVLGPAFLGQYLPATLDRPKVLGLDTADERVFYYLLLALLVALTYGVMRVRRSRSARAVIACRDNELAAQSFGISVARARLQAFALSGFLAAMAGGLFAFAEHGVHPADFSIAISLQIFLVTLAGGLGSVWGPLIGMAFYALLTTFLPGYAGLISSAGVVVLFMFFPAGLGGMVFAVRDAWLRRVARRNKIVVPSLLADLREGGQRVRAPIAPKMRKGTTVPAFVPPQYRVSDQWSLGAEPPATTGSKR